MNISIKAYCMECGDIMKKDKSRRELLKNRLPVWRCEKKCTSIFVNIVMEEDTQ